MNLPTLETIALAAFAATIFTAGTCLIYWAIMAAGAAITRWLDET